MLFSSKALRLVVSASVASFVVAQEACVPMEYAATLKEGVDCDTFQDELAAAGGVYIDEDGPCSPFDGPDDDLMIAYISVCPEDGNTDNLEAIAELAADDEEIDIEDPDDEPVEGEGDDDDFFDDEDDDDASEDGDPFIDELGGDLDLEDDLDLEEGSRKLIEERKLRKVFGKAHEPWKARLFRKGYHWNLEAINATQAWQCDKHLGNPDIHVAVIDTGIDYTHKELAGKVNLTKSKCFVPEKGSRGSKKWSHRDFHSHGTAVASIVSSNAFHVAGVTSKTSLISMKACDRHGKCSLMAMLRALRRSVRVGADVAVLRWTDKFVKDEKKSWARIFNRALLSARRKGMTVVVGAGDNKHDLDHDHPDALSLFCDLDNVICVSATGPLSSYHYHFSHPDFPAYYSNYGLNAIDVAAPGGSRGGGVPAACSRSRHSKYPRCHYSASHRKGRGGYAFFRGTAYAAAHVAGLAALLVDTVGRMPAVIKKKIEDTADEFDPYDPYFGGNGRINMQAALCPEFCCSMNTRDTEGGWNSGDMFPVNGCTEYVTCNEENMGMQTTPLPCPAGLLFKRMKWSEDMPWGGYCDWPANVDCDAQPTCMPGGGQD